MSSPHPISTTQRHHFTVIVPTRERCDTLAHALRTCVAQDYENLDIIVSDNCSQDRTREVVASCRDPRIRYLNTGRRVSMSDNYEFALAQVRPEGYVMLLGDDDGLLPHAIRDINDAIVRTGTAVFRWEVFNYAWPFPGGGGGNTLAIPSLRSGLAVRDAASTIRRVVSFKDPYRLLPCMYIRSAVDYRIIAQIKEATGRFYHSMTPDVYSGFVIAEKAGRFVDSERPYSVGGNSHHSTGSSTLTDARVGVAARKYLSEDNLPFHPEMVFCLCEPAFVAECFLQARDHLGFSHAYALDMERMLACMMAAATSKEEANYLTVRDAVLRLGVMHGAEAAARRAVAGNPRQPQGGAAPRRTIGRTAQGLINLGRKFVADVRGRDLEVDCAPFGVTNVYDATLLADHILRLNDMRLLGTGAGIRRAVAGVSRAVFRRRRGGAGRA
jgi:hypothetical protein